MKKTLSLILAIALIVTCSSTVYAGSRSSKKIRLSKSSVTMKVSQSRKLYLSKNGRKISSGVKWKSSNKKVVTVSGGKLKAKKKGSATVTAKYKGKKYKCKVKVKKSSSKKPYIPKAYDLKIPEASYEAAREMEQLFISREAFNLWIPFDYGIGPSVYKKNFEGYMEAIKGAPKSKNYEYSDFN